MAKLTLMYSTLDSMTTPTTTRMATVSGKCYSCHLNTMNLSIIAPSPISKSMKITRRCATMSLSHYVIMPLCHYFAIHAPWLIYLVIAFSAHISITHKIIGYNLHFLHRSLLCHILHIHVSHSSNSSVLYI